MAIVLLLSTTLILFPKRRDNIIVTLDNLCFSFSFYRQCTYIIFFQQWKISKTTANFTIKNKSKRRSNRFKGVLFHVRTNLKIQILLLLFITFYKQGPSWPWSYGSWIYNYLCNRSLSPLMLWVRIPLSARCTILC